MLRIVVALLVLFALTAFAPAPFPKVRRNQDVTTLESCQGLWKVEYTQVSNGQGPPSKYNWGISHIRISEGGRWTLMNNGGVVADVYRIVIDPSKSPAHVDWVRREGNSTTIEFVGIVKRQGNRMLITYISGSTNRPTSFETLPASTYLVTTTRE